MTASLVTVGLIQAAEVVSLYSPLRIVLVESIPEGLDFNSTTSHPSIYHAWLNLMSEARSSVDIASFYWTLTNDDTGTQEPTAQLVSPSFAFENIQHLFFVFPVIAAV